MGVGPRPSAVTDVGSYVIWLSDQISSQVVTFPNVMGTSFTLTGAHALTRGHNYTWYVGAVSTNGLVTVWSSGVTVMG